MSLNRGLRRSHPLTAKLRVRVLGSERPRRHLSNDQYWKVDEHASASRRIDLDGASDWNSGGNICVSTARVRRRHIRDYNVSGDTGSSSVLHWHTLDIHLCRVAELVPARRDIS